MNIISKYPNENGAFSAIHNQDIQVPPDGFYEVADGVTLSCVGFGTLTVENDVVTAFTPDEEKWNAWKVEHPDPTPELTLGEKMTALQEENTQLKDTLFTLDSTLQTVMEVIIPSLTT